MPYSGQLPSARRPQTVQPWRAPARSTIRRPFRRAGMASAGARGVAGGGFMQGGATLTGQPTIGPGSIRSGTAMNPATQRALGALPRQSELKREYNRQVLVGVAAILKQINSAREDLGQNPLEWRKMTKTQREALLRRAKFVIAEEAEE